jgi:hypothetical protein
MHHIKSKLIVAIIAIASGFLFTPSVFANDNCKVKSFSALPHTFTGVSRCNDKNENEREAQKACNVKAKELYPDTAFSIREFYSPSWQSSSKVSRKCKRRALGACVDYYRECKATFSKLNCKIKVCRKEW